MQLGRLLDWFWIDFGSNLGGKFGVKLSSKSEKKRCQDDVKKTYKTRCPSRPGSARAGGVVVPIINSNPLPDQLHGTLDTHFVPFRSSRARWRISTTFICPRGYPIWQKAFESSHKTSLSTLTWPFRDDFSIPSFFGFSFLPRATFFFPHTPRPIRSLLRLQYSPNRIYQLLPDRFLFFFFHPDPPRIFT